MKGERDDDSNTAEAADLYEEEQWYERSALSVLCRTQSSFESKFTVKPHDVSENRRALRTPSKQTRIGIWCETPLQGDLVLDIVREEKITKQVQKFMADDNLWNGHGGNLLAHFRKEVEASLPEGISSVSTDNEIWDKVNKLRKEQGISPMLHSGLAWLHQSAGTTCDDTGPAPTKQGGALHMAPAVPSHGDAPLHRGIYALVLAVAA